MELVAGIDLGTSYFKVGLFGRDGTMHGLGRVAIGKDTGDGSRCEVPTQWFWDTLQQAFTQACTQAHATPEHIKALSYSSQANSFLLLDKNNVPLTPLVLWPDIRDERLDSVVSDLWKHPKFLAITGLGLDAAPRFCVNKLKWFQKHQSDVWAHTHRVMTISDYFVFALTGQFVGDAGTASLLGVYDLPHHTWWVDAFSRLAIDPSYFSTPLMPAAAVGTITPQGTALLGLNARIPLAVGSLDHHMAAIGAGAPSIAPTSESTGTVVACLNYITDFAPKPGCCMGPGLDNNTFYQLAFSSNGAGVLEWYRRNFAADMSIADLLLQAQDMPEGADGLVALPSADTYSNLTGFRNASSKHAHGHYIRAILESNAATLKQLMEQIRGKSMPSHIVATGGGARGDLWLQIKANMLGTEIITTNCEEPACRGAAMFASTSLNWFTNIQDVQNAWVKVTKRFRSS